MGGERGCICVHTHTHHILYTHIQQGMGGNPQTRARTCSPVEPCGEGDGREHVGHVRDHLGRDVRAWFWCGLWCGVFLVWLVLVCLFLVCFGVFLVLLVGWWGWECMRCVVPPWPHPLLSPLSHINYTHTTLTNGVGPTQILPQDDPRFQGEADHVGDGAVEEDRDRGGEEHPDQVPPLLRRLILLVWWID